MSALRVASLVVLVASANALQVQPQGAPKVNSKAFISVNKSKAQSTASQRPHEVRQILQYGWPAEELGTKGKDESACGQAWLVSSLLGCKKDGYFLDLGAHAAVDKSTTLMLERDFGWQGICFEANPTYFDSLLKRRCDFVNAAIGGPTGTHVKFDFGGGDSGGIVNNDFDNSNTSNVNATGDLRTIALADILQKVGAPSSIDFFSLDVEGAESMIMDRFPWGQYSFKVFMVERPKPDLRKTLASHGYRRLRQNCRCGGGFGDQTWIHESLPDFHNVMDTFKNGVKPSGTCMEKQGHPWPAGLAVDDAYTGSEAERADDRGEHNNHYEKLCKKLEHNQGAVFGQNLEE